MVSFLQRSQKNQPRVYASEIECTATMFEFFTRTTQARGFLGWERHSGC